MLSPDLHVAAARPTWLKDLVLIALIAAVWFGAFIGLRPLANPDEGRYTEISREMALSNDYVTPRLNGLKYFEKPPLVYWLSALTFEAFGVNHFTARLWVALFATLGVLLTYAAARSLHGRGAGIWSAIVLATMLLYYGLAQVILLDMAVSVTISGALFTFLLAVREPRGRKRLYLFLAFYAFMALATLTKGLIGFLLPGAVAFLWLLLMNRWRDLRPFHPVAGVALFLAIAAPWHVMAALANHSVIKEHDFAWFYFVHEHYLRFTTTVHKREEPCWFVLPFLVGGLFPWTFFSWQSLRESLRGGWRARVRNAEAWYFIIWIAFIVLFFSISQSKLIPYILPVIPAAAVLIGRYVSSKWDAVADKGFRVGGWSFVGCLGLMAIAVFFVPGPKENPDFTASLPLLRGLACALCLGGAAAVGFALRRDRPRLVIGAVAVWSAVLFASIAMSGKSMHGDSTLELCNILKPRLKPGDRICHVGLYAQDMPVYLDREVSIASYKGELLFGIEAEPAKAASRIFSKDDFVGQWRESGTTYALIRQWYYDKWFKPLNLSNQIIGKCGDVLLLVNRSPVSPP